MKNHGFDSMVEDSIDTLILLNDLEVRYFNDGVFVAVVPSGSISIGCYLSRIQNRGCMVTFRVMDGVLILVISRF